MPDSQNDQSRNSLVGYDVVLNPLKAGMYRDSVNNFILSFFEKGKDRITITDSMDVTFILRSIKHGILKVFKKQKDVSDKFGGKEDDMWHRKPLVTISKSADKNADKYIIKILANNDENKVLQDIRSINDFETLCRLEELELKGTNNLALCRDNVIKCIHEIKKNINGISLPKEEDGEKEMVAVNYSSPKERA